MSFAALTHPIRPRNTFDLSAPIKAPRFFALNAWFYFVFSVGTRLADALRGIRSSQSSLYDKLIEAFGLNVTATLAVAIFLTATSAMIYSVAGWLYICAKRGLDIGWGRHASGLIAIAFIAAILFANAKDGNLVEATWTSFGFAILVAYLAAFSLPTSLWVYCIDNFRKR